MSATPSAPKTNGKAIASLVLSILGIVGILPVLGPILGIILGNSARREIARNPQVETGEGIARAGVILGWVGLALELVALICILVIFGSAIGWALLGQR